MTTVRLGPSTTRSELRDAHELLASGDGAPATLVLDDGLQSATPGQFSAWIQMVFTWGQGSLGRTLQLTAGGAERFSAPDSLSDIEVFAALLAEAIEADGVDVTATVQRAARQVFAQRKVLTRHDGDGEQGMSSLLLAAHIFSNQTSPETHARWMGKLGIEESARTLFHDIWPSELPVRQPLLEFGEVAVRSGEHVYVTRQSSAEDLGVGDAGFISLGARAPQVRGIAHELATEVRQQPKPVHDEVGELLFELVQNTEWHAVRQSGGRTGANCRALAFREYTYDVASMNSAEFYDSNFASYARSVLAKVQGLGHPEARRVTLGSITVVDSGAGLARSAAIAMGEEDQLSVATEISYLTKALSKHLKRRRAELGNIGLARVQLLLTNLSGFMSVRTGSVEIVRNFVDKPFDFINPDKVHTTSPSLILDWIPADANDFIAGPRIGTAVTIVYPVDFEVAQ